MYSAGNFFYSFLFSCQATVSRLTVLLHCVLQLYVVCEYSVIDISLHSVSYKCVQNVLLICTVYTQCVHSLCTQCLYVAINVLFCVHIYASLSLYVCVSVSVSVCSVCLWLPLLTLLRLSTLKPYTMHSPSYCMCIGRVQLFHLN